MNKTGKYLTIEKMLLIILLIICSIFSIKKIFIEPKNILEVSTTSFIYPITFLLIILIRNKTSFKEAHKIVIITSILFLVFNLLLSIMASIPSNYETLELDVALKQTLTPNYISIFNFSIYYPNILNVISLILLFYISHTIIMILYEAMTPYTNTFIAFSLSLFIPYTLDTICYTVINDISKSVEFNKLIIDLTSNFVIIIISTLLLSIIYTIIKKVGSKTESEA